VERPPMHWGQHTSGQVKRHRSQDAKEVRLVADVPRILPGLRIVNSLYFRLASDCQPFFGGKVADSLRD
jgi:hypothetical protein